MAFDIEDVGRLTNKIHDEMLQAEIAERNGNADRAQEHYLAAVIAGCRASRGIISPNFEEWSRVLPRHRDTAQLRKMLSSPELVQRFLDTERELLQKINLNGDLIDSVISGAEEFITKDPDEWDDEWDEDTLLKAFRGVQERACRSATEQLENIKTDRDRQEWLRNRGKDALNTGIGGAIIAVDYYFLGPIEFFCQVSTAYGCSWLPIWPWRR